MSSAANLLVWTLDIAGELGSRSLERCSADMEAILTKKTKLERARKIVPAKGFASGGDRIITSQHEE